MGTLLYPSFPLLLIDDEEAWLNSLSLTLRSNGITNIVCCSDSRKAMNILNQEPFTAMVLDLIMPHLSGDELLPQVIQSYPDMPVIVITGLDQVDIAVECMKSGAFDYQTKVTEDNRLVESIKRAVEFGLLRRENLRLKERFLHDRLDHPEAFTKIITRNKAMRSIFQYMEAISNTNEPVLITGETGTGKELVALALHKLSKRKGNFVAINIAGLDDSVFSDSLFGHTKGAFTGADQSRNGLIVKASGGTLFLDEIGDLENPSQVKLLRLLQEREFLPIGSDTPTQTNTRMIFATHKELSHLQESDAFRADLFFRLRSHHIHIPPLRERYDDIPLLVDHFLNTAAELQNKTVPSYPPELITLLSTYHFPGNIRELQSMIFDALSRHTTKTLGMEAFKNFVSSQKASSSEASHPQESANPFVNMHQLPTLKESGNILVAEAIKRSGGNQTIAAELLGISRQALGWRLKKGQANE